MQARCEIAHEVGPGRAGTVTFASLDEVLGTAGERYHGDGYKTRRQAITGIDADLDGLTAEARVDVEPLGPNTPAVRGIESAYQPAFSMVDCFVVHLQLAQVLLYGIDSIARHQSNTLWMQRTDLVAAQPPRPHQGPEAVRASITRNQVIPLRGASWRNIEVRGGLGGTDLRCSLAHELPAGALAAAD